MIDLAKLRAMKACPGHNYQYVMERDALQNVSSCDSCLRLVVAAVMEEAAGIAENLYRTEEGFVVLSGREIASKLRHAAKV